MTDEIDRVAEFLEHMQKERDVSPNTVKAYTRDLAEFVAYLGNYYGTAGWTWQGVDRLAIRGYLAHIVRRGISKRSAGRSLSAVRSLYKFLHRNEIVEANPARAIASPKRDKYLPEYLDIAQMGTLFSAAETRSQGGKFTDIRNLAMLELFYSAGLRLSELRGIHRDSLDLLANQVKVRGKGRKERIVPLGDRAILALRNYEARRDDLWRAIGSKGDRSAFFLSSHGRRISARALQNAMTALLDLVSQTAS